MEPNEIQTVLTAAVEEVLETMCFTTVLRSSEGPAPDSRGGERTLTAELGFEGVPSGGFRVSVDRKVAKMLSAGFFGLDEGEITDEQSADLVCELANMICGSVLSRLERNVTFHISHPELVDADAGSCFTDESPCRWFDLGDGQMSTALRFQKDS
jgi:CheY-specific phosphatase CheX